MRKLVFAAVATGAMLVAACTSAPPPEPIDPHTRLEMEECGERGGEVRSDAKTGKPRCLPIEAEAKACEAKGGKVLATGMMGNFNCVVPYSDGGKDCTTGEDCMGDCRADPEDKPGKDGKLHGRCQRDSTPFGCYAIIEQGKVEGAPLCVD